MKASTGHRRNRWIALFPLLLGGMILAAMLVAAIARIPGQIEANRQLADRVARLEHLSQRSLPIRPRGIEQQMFADRDALAAALTKRAGAHGIELQFEAVDAGDGWAGVAIVAEGDAAEIMATIADLEAIRPTVRLVNWRIEAGPDKARLTGIARGVTR